MILYGANIYSEGVKIGHGCEEKIRQIMTTLRIFSNDPELSMRFVKSGKQYEVMVWGRAGDSQVGAYNRGWSLDHVLDLLHKKIKRQCWRAQPVQAVRRMPDLALAS